MLKHYHLFGVKGVLRRALLSVAPTHNEFTAATPDSHGKVILRLGTTDVAAFEHVFIHKEYDLCLAHKPSLIVDAGANVGMSAVYFSQRYPNAKVIAIEPDPDNFRILKKNAELFPSILPVNAALWNSDNVVSMHDGGSGGWGMQVREPGNRSSVLVRSMRVQTLLNEHQMTQIDLLKMDVEGAEQEIFQDASAWIDRVTVVCVELHDRFRPGCSKAFEIATSGFPVRWRRGELTCVAREGAVLAREVTFLVGKRSTC